MSDCILPAQFINTDLSQHLQHSPSVVQTMFPLLKFAVCTVKDAGEVVQSLTKPSRGGSLGSDISPHQHFISPDWDSSSSASFEEIRD